MCSTYLWIYIVVLKLKNTVKYQVVALALPLGSASRFQQPLGYRNHVEPALGLYKKSTVKYKVNVLIYFDRNIYTYNRRNEENLNA